jgi:multidrug transporter EmrE-like cation transporter
MGKYAKALVAAATAGLAALGTALADDTITRLEWIGVAVAVVGALGLTYAVPNKPSVESH